MTGHDCDPLIDELRAALDVAPSADFAARVRRAAATRQPPSGGWWMALTGAAACAVAVTLVLIGWRVSRKPAPALVVVGPSVSEQQTIGPTQPTNTLSARSVSSGTRGGHVSVTRRSSSVAPGSSPQSSEPDLQIIIAPEEGIALRRLMASLKANAGAVPRMTGPAEDADGRLVGPTPISIPVLTIEPLTPRASGVAEEKHR